ncbi:Uu.00g083240.m01.CDS01 [Anthostomella pinea]|uniref:Uu.00g083240.m01.CDS01 n=1 Tax=Anthostomella pinea TaxID=933095 RepID=A0AAI8VLL4_9PEZI|nr:Uu.00g083240.m01.CDS01 [Anthostomella pinea]
MALLLDRRGDKLPVTEEVVKAAAGNWNGKQVMTLLFDQRGDEVPVTEEVVKAAARNGRNGKE